MPRAINLIFNFTLVMLRCYKMRIILGILVPVVVLLDSRLDPVLSHLMLLREVIVFLIVASIVIVSKRLDVVNAEVRVLYRLQEVVWVACVLGATVAVHVAFFAAMERMV